MSEPSRFADHASQALRSIDANTISSDLQLTIEQRILDGDEIVDRYSVTLANGQASIARDDVDADIVISQDAATAQAIQAGETHAQTAYLTGRLTIDGDVDKLLAHGPALQSIVSAMGQHPHGDA